MSPFSYKWFHQLRKVINKHKHLSYFMLIIVGIVISSNIGKYFPSYADEGTGVSKPIVGTFGTLHTFGNFLPLGNAGILTLFNANPQLELDPINNTLSGWVWSQTVGWIEFGVSGYPVQLIPPLSTTSSALDPWTLSGYVWSENAGWITLNALNASYSGASFLPSTLSFTGYAWGDAIGYVDFGKTQGLSDGFIGKVKIIGNGGGGKMYDAGIGNYTKESSINSMNTTTDFLNFVKKNIAFITRNVPVNKFNTTNSNSSINLGTAKIYRPTTDSISFSGKTRFDASTRSIIVDGGDVYIDTDILSTSTDPSRAIIALKDKNGNKGNIYIDGSVKKINASLIAEGSIYSGKNITTLYNSDKNSLTNLPINQLWIVGLVISHNTIGGSTTSPSVVCPYGAIVCNRDTALRYDMNYFRNFTPGDTMRRAYSNATLDGYSVIIEYDPKTIISPPVGIKTEQ